MSLAEHLPRRTGTGGVWVGGITSLYGLATSDLARIRAVSTWLAPTHPPARIWQVQQAADPTAPTASVGAPDGRLGHRRSSALRPAFYATGHGRGADPPPCLSRTDGEGSHRHIFWRLLTPATYRTSIAELPRLCWCGFGNNKPGLFYLLATSAHEARHESCTPFPRYTKLFQCFFVDYNGNRHRWIRCKAWLPCSPLCILASLPAGYLPYRVPYPTHPCGCGRRSVCG